MKKFKISRKFTYKAYVLEAGNGIEFLSTMHIGEFMTKSDCHYYCEKAVLDAIQANPEHAGEHIYGIYKVSTIEDTTIEDMLLEVIKVEDGRIVVE